MRIIGLTGGIASGKSTVASYLEQLGATIIDADELARDIVSPGMPALDAIVAEFGDELLSHDGTLDRPALGRRVFSDPDSRRRLEAITHPAIGRLAEEKLATFRSAGVRIAVYMAALLIEAGVTGRVDELWVVYVNRETQIVRLMQREAMNRGDALMRIESQMPMDQKREFGRVIIDNSGTRKETELQVREAWRDLMGRC